MSYFDSRTVFQSSASVLPPSKRSLGTAATQLSHDELMKRLNERAFDPTVFDQSAPIFFPVEMSSNALDSYWTRMTPKTLQNYAEDASSGVSFQDSHRTNALGLGQTLSGFYTQEGEIARALADVFTAPGTPDIDAFVHKLRAGIARDCSVGFYRATFICGVCNLDLFDWDCPHIPGLLYPSAEFDSMGNKQADSEVRAFAWVDDARLAELSAVYEGATPGAGILKAQQESDGGRVTADIAERFTRAYRGALIPGYRPLHSVAGDGKRNWPYAEKEAESKNDTPGAPGHNEENRTMDKNKQTPGAEGEQNAPDEIRSVILTACRDLKLEPGDAESGLRTLQALARDGQSYRSELIEDALKEGARALGESFKPELYRGMFATIGIDAVRQMRDDWQKTASQTFKGGRKTEEGEGAKDDVNDEEKEKEQRSAPIDDDADIFSIIPTAAFR